MSYNLFLDDERFPETSLKLITRLYNLYNDNNNWKIVRTYEEFVEMIENDGLPDFISFDHDLGCIIYPSEIHMKRRNRKKDIIRKTGYDCAKWLVNYSLENELKLPDFQVHSANPVGKENIEKFFENYKKHCK